MKEEYLVRLSNLLTRTLPSYLLHPSLFGFFLNECLPYIVYYTALASQVELALWRTSRNFLPTTSPTVQVESLLYSSIQAGQQCCYLGLTVKVLTIFYDCYQPSPQT